MYSHKYAELPLIPVEVFLSQFPEHATLDENELMLARIEHEFTDRQVLENQRQELLKKKMALQAGNKQRKVDLANLDKDLEKFIDAANPILKTFGKLAALLALDIPSRSSHPTWRRGCGNYY